MTSPTRVAAALAALLVLSAPLAQAQTKPELVVQTDTPALSTR